ncbi:MAG: response regulator transcription factor [Burkholderiales bacterium]|nr:response regulator transcription factor [Burkholderiales bacterium]
MRLALVDDEPLARQRLRALLQSLPELHAQVLVEAGDADEALALLRATPVDAVLLDIRMPGPGPNAGLALARALRRLSEPPALIFVTAHAEHAVRAFDLEATDYLTKPVRRERLLAALLRVAPPLREPAPPAPEPVLLVRDRGRLLRLPLAEVLYLKAELKYVTLRTALHAHLLDDSLSVLARRVGPGFIRVHRNALVAQRAIRALERRDRATAGDAAGAAGARMALREGDGEGEGWAVRVAPLDEWLAVSRRQLAEVRAALSRR